MAGFLRRTPLRVKLVTAVLALVTVALVVISVASTVALRSYQLDRVDDQLWDTVRRAEERGMPIEPIVASSDLPSDFLVVWQVWQVAPPTILVYDKSRYLGDDLPPLWRSLDEVEDRAREPFTVEAINGDRSWRVLVVLYPGNISLTVAQDISDLDSTVGSLIWTEVIVGGIVLALLAAAGVWMVRTSLRPLREIERTAGAIAAGHLSSRVPNPEPGPGPPRTEVGRLSYALNVMLTQIETAFAARAASEHRMRQFVADASHELRTPLTTIRGFAELYRQGAAKTPEEVGKLVRRIEDEASRMGLLVEDLLLLARLDQERPLELARVELPVIVSDAVDAARAFAPDRTIELEVRSDGVPLVVQGDDARLRQVVGNLLSNAVTHTPDGTPVTVRLRAEPGTAVLEVADRGPGLTREQAERVFERFYRADSARSRRLPGGRRAAGGTGLGLAIVAALVAAHRGAVEVDSGPGKGATFRVRLPLAPPAPTAETQAGSSDVEE
ncbi:MAG TPA: HAMP domain-containing sensor histidine kinase [Natronosporangium sp.]